MRIRLVQEMTMEFKEDYNANKSIGESIENGTLIFSDAVIKILDEDGEELDFNLNDNEMLLGVVNELKTRKS